ncbi:unnamed protein product, partial [Effrenium voratum]
MRAPFIQRRCGGSLGGAHRQVHRAPRRDLPELLALHPVGVRVGAPEGPPGHGVGGGVVRQEVPRGDLAAAGARLPPAALGLGGRPAAGPVPPRDAAVLAGTLAEPPLSNLRLHPAALGHLPDAAGALQLFPGAVCPKCRLLRPRCVWGPRVPGAAREGRRQCARACGKGGEAMDHLASRLLFLGGLGHLWIFYMVASFFPLRSLHSPFHRDLGSMAAYSKSSLRVMRVFLPLVSCAKLVALWVRFERLQLRLRLLGGDTALVLLAATLPLLAVSVCVAVRSSFYSHYHFSSVLLAGMNGLLSIGFARYLEVGWAVLCVAAVLMVWLLLFAQYTSEFTKANLIKAAQIQWAFVHGLVLLTLVLALALEVEAGFARRFVHFFCESQTLVPSKVCKRLLSRVFAVFCADVQNPLMPFVQGLVQSALGTSNLQDPNAGTPLDVVCMLVSEEDGAPLTLQVVLSVNADARSASVKVVATNEIYMHEHVDQQQLHSVWIPDWSIMIMGTTATTDIVVLSGHESVQSSYIARPWAPLGSPEGKQLSCPSQQSDMALTFCRGICVLTSFKGEIPRERQSDPCMVDPVVVLLAADDGTVNFHFCDHNLPAPASSRQPAPLRIKTP